MGGSPDSAPYRPVFSLLGSKAKSIYADACINVLVTLHYCCYENRYGLENLFYPTAYGPRSLKAVLVVTHANGSTLHVSPTCSAVSTAGECNWKHGSGSTTFEDLHTGQLGDGRLATPGWESTSFAPAAGVWQTPPAVAGPVGELQPHPMQRSRVLEVVRPTR